MIFPEDFINKIICGDSLQIMKNMPNECIDLVITSPPFNMSLRKTFGNTKNWKGKTNNSKLQSQGYDIHNDYMPEDKYIVWQKDILKECLRLIKKDGAILYNHRWRVQNRLLQQRSELMEGLPLRQIIIWQKSGGFNFAETHLLPTYEIIYLIAKHDFKLAPKTNVYGDVWKIHQETKSWHPAAFPIELAKRCCELSTGNIILDCFSGSGTTAVAAKMLGKNYIGIDLSQNYCDKAEQRLKDLAV